LLGFGVPTGRPVKVGHVHHGRHKIRVKTKRGLQFGFGVAGPAERGIQERQVEMILRTFGGGHLRGDQLRHIAIERGSLSCSQKLWWSSCKQTRCFYSDRPNRVAEQRCSKTNPFFGRERLQRSDSGTAY
jgi:hypothetical protein